MTEPNELLSLLADIQEPALLQSFALAPGHWLLLSLLCLLLLALAYRLWCYWRKYAAKRQAWREFQALDPADPELASKLNLLLKRLIKSYWPQHPLLSATTGDWQQHWQQHLPAGLVLPELTALLYQAPQSGQSAAQQQLYRCAKAYLQAFRPRQLAPAKGSQSNA